MGNENGTVQDAEILEEKATRPQKVELHELEEIKQRMGALDEVRQKIADNFIVEQRCIADKPKLMFEFNQVTAEYTELQNKLGAKYGSQNMNVNLQDGTITYK